MTVEVREEPLSSLAEYARVPIAFEVRTMLDLDVRDGGLGGIVLAERVVEAPYVKDYDALDGGPARWPARFDLSRWGLLAARDGGRLIGGAAVAFDTPGVDMLEGRRDLAVLWDIRVATEARGHGVGAALFRAGEAWAAARGCRWLKVETQNVNVPACRFYARQGCVLGGIHRFAYPELPDEVQLLWYKDLRSAGAAHHPQTKEPGDGRYGRRDVPDHGDGARGVELLRRRAILRSGGVQPARERVPRAGDG